MVSLSNHVAISMRLNTRRRTAVATATRLPRYARNDKVGMLLSCTPLLQSFSMTPTQWRRQVRQYSTGYREGGLAVSTHRFCPSLTNSIVPSRAVRNT